MDRRKRLATAIVVGTRGSGTVLDLPHEVTLTTS
jgi:hypothetical protein